MVNYHCIHLWPPTSSMEVQKRFWGKSPVSLNEVPPNRGRQPTIIYLFTHDYCKSSEDVKPSDALDKTKSKVGIRQREQAL